MAVDVVSPRFGKRAVCECGWTGKTRLLRGSAVADVFIHCAQHTSDQTVAEPMLRAS